NCSSAAEGEFHPSAVSPAIDSSDSGARDQPNPAIAGNPRVDAPPTPHTGTGVRSYDDRGAYEFQPGPVTDAAPTARISVTPSSGAAPLTVMADASASSDTDATPISTY